MSLLRVPARRLYRLADTLRMRPRRYLPVHPMHRDRGRNCALTLPQDRWGSQGSWWNMPIRREYLMAGDRKRPPRPPAGPRSAVRTECRHSGLQWTSSTERRERWAFSWKGCRTREPYRRERYYSRGVPRSSLHAPASGPPPAVGMVQHRLAPGSASRASSRDQRAGARLWGR